jgi:hypothetical protein
MDKLFVLEEWFRFVLFNNKLKTNVYLSLTLI